MIRFTPDAKLFCFLWLALPLIVGGRACAAEPSPAQPVPQVLREHVDNIYSWSFSADGRLLASASGDNTAVIWDVAQQSALHVLQQDAAVYCAVFRPDGRQLVTGSGDGMITTWDCSTGQMVRQVRRHADAVYSLAITRDGQRIASVGGNGDGGDTMCRLWNAETLEMTAEWQGHTMPVYGVAFSPDGSMLATTSRDKTVRLWNVASGSHRVMQGHTSDVYRCGFSPDGRWLATASQDATVRIWDVSEARLAHVAWPQGPAVRGRLFA